MALRAPPLRSSLYAGLASQAYAEGPDRSTEAQAGGSPVTLASTVEEADVFAEGIRDAVDSLPADLRDALSNVEVVVEDEPPAGRRLLGLYRGVPLTRRTTSYAAVLPDKITIFRGPIERLAAHDPERLRAEIRHVVLHEIAHHFGISDQRLIEIDRY